MNCNKTKETADVHFELKVKGFPIRVICFEIEKKH